MSQQFFSFSFYYIGMSMFFGKIFEWLCLSQFSEKKLLHIDPDSVSILPLTKRRKFIWFLSFCFSVKKTYFIFAATDLKSLAMRQCLAMFFFRRWKFFFDDFSARKRFITIEGAVLNEGLIIAFALWWTLLLPVTLETQDVVLKRVALFTLDTRVQKKTAILF